jgi:hypothetical protein
MIHVLVKPHTSTATIIIDNPVQVPTPVGADPDRGEVRP